MNIVLILLSLVFVSSCSTSRRATEPTAEQNIACPQPGSGETAEDCPWAEITRKIALSTKAGRPASFALQTESPEIYRQMAADSENPKWLALWGTSINYDELAKGVIIQPELIGAISGIFRQPFPAVAGDERLVHAGIEHTYGYLFSNLKTPFGYKRARWVKPTLDRGFGLPVPTLSPKTTSGTLFSNVTYFAGRIAFQKDRAALRTLEAGKREASPAVRNYPYSLLKVTRLVETVRLPEDKRKVTIRTDFVEFHDKVEGDSNTHLLVYSIDDPARGGPRLITAFPVQASFVEMATQPANLGKDKEIVTRYNAYVPGLTGQKLKGERKIQ